jgi:hypothetical protein
MDASAAVAAATVEGKSLVLELQVLALATCEIYLLESLQ